MSGALLWPVARLKCASDTLGYKKEPRWGAIGVRISLHLCISRNNMITLNMQRGISKLMREVFLHRHGNWCD
jgi:hypothetical protein